MVASVFWISAKTITKVFYVILACCCVVARLSWMVARVISHCQKSKESTPSLYVVLVATQGLIPTFIVRLWDLFAFFIVCPAKILCLKKKKIKRICTPFLSKINNLRFHSYSHHKYVFNVVMKWN